ncbi:MAG: hypothetical protein AAB799_00630 [Patescibacteria group bacterium]
MLAVGVLSFLILVLTLFATVNILLSIWFRFWKSKNMSESEKREVYVRQRYDIKWSLSLAFVGVLSALMFQLFGLGLLANLNLLVSLLFWLLFWGNHVTWSVEKKRLDRKRSFGI